jgi:2-dehydro-3-deoxygalactonokinase
LCSQTTLVPNNAKSETDASAFARGVGRIRQHPQAELLHKVFECRSLRLSGELAPEETASYLSGMLIASDVSGAVRLLAPSAVTPTVYVIGSSELNTLYATALRTQECGTHVLDGSAASVAGLARIDQLRSS